MKKKIVSLLLCVALVCAMAVPAFADWSLEPDYMFPSDRTPYRLNIYGTTGSAMKGRPLVLWTAIEGSEDQLFTGLYDSYEGKPCVYFTRIQNGKTYAINRASYSVAGGRAAIMWSLSDGKEESACYPPKPAPDRWVCLLNFNEGLSYSGKYSGATVYFSEGSWSQWTADGSPKV